MVELIAAVIREEEEVDLLFYDDTEGVPVV
jgi:hypothetical protein